MEAVLENKYICRICLKVLDTTSQSFGYIEDETGTLKEMLFCCIPEMDIYVSTDPIVCLTCIQTLVGLYNFKTKCVNTETIIRTYMRRNNLLEYSHVNLTCVVQDLLKQTNIQNTAVQQKPENKPETPNNNLNKEPDAKDTGQTKIPEFTNQESNSSNESTISKESSDSNEMPNSSEDHTPSPSHANITSPPLVFSQNKSTDSIYNPLNQTSALSDSVPFLEDRTTSQKVPVPSQLNQVAAQADPMTSQLILMPPQINPGLSQINPFSSQVNLVPSQMNPVGSQINPVPSQINPVASQMNLQSQTNPVASQMNPGASQMNPVPSQLNPVPPQMNLVASQMNPIQSQLNPVSPQMNPGASQMNPVASHMNPVASQMNTVASQLNPVASQINQGLSQMNPSELNPAPSQMNSFPSQINPSPSHMNPVPSQMNVAPSQMNPIPSQINQAIPPLNSKMNLLPAMLNQAAQPDAACSQMNLPQMRQYPNQVHNMSSQSNSMPPHLNHFPEHSNSMSSQMGNMISQMNQIQMDPQRNYMTPQLNQISGRLDQMSPPLNPISSHLNQMAARLESTSPRMSPLQSHLNQVPRHMDNMSPNLVHRQPQPHLLYYRHYPRPPQSSMVNNTENSRQNEMQHAYGMHNHLNERNNFASPDLYEGKMSYNARAHMEPFHPYGARVSHMFPRTPHMGHPQSNFTSMGHPQTPIHQMRPPQMGSSQYNRITTSPHLQMRPPSPHIQMRPPSPHIQMKSSSPHIQMKPPSPHIQMRPPSPQIQVRPPYHLFPRNSFEMDLRPPAPPPSPAPAPSSQVNYTPQNTNNFSGSIQFKPYALNTVFPQVSTNPPVENRQCISPDPFLTPIPAIESPVVPLSVHIASLTTLQLTPIESQNKAKDPEVVNASSEENVEATAKAQNTEKEEQVSEPNNTKVSSESNDESLNKRSENHPIEQKLKLVIQLPRKIDIPIKTEKIDQDEPDNEEKGDKTEENMTDNLVREPQKIQGGEGDMGDNLHASLGEHSNSFLYECFKCSFSTPNTEDFIKHREKCIEEMKLPFQCSHCSHSSSSEAGMDKHIKTAHSKDVKWLYCEHCSYKSTDRYNLNTHRNIRHHEKLVCEQCDYTCVNTESFNKHLRSAHVMKRREFACKICDFKTNSESKLFNHNKNNKHTTTSVHCEWCSYSTNDKANFRRHIFIHSPTKIDCDFCDYKNVSPYQLIKHLKKYHSGVGIEDVDLRNTVPLTELMDDIRAAIKEASQIKI